MPADCHDLRRSEKKNNNTDTPAVYADFLRSQKKKKTWPSLYIIFDIRCDVGTLDNKMIEYAIGNLQ